MPGIAELATRTLGLGPTREPMSVTPQRAPPREHQPPAPDAIYTGVLYKNLGLCSLDGAARRSAASSLAITSSLFGLVRPSRPDARRTASPARSTSPASGVVSAHWRKVLDPVVGASRPATDGLVDLPVEHLRLRSAARP